MKKKRDSQEIRKFVARDLRHRAQSTLKTKRFELATNGFRLEEFKDSIGVFDNVDLGYYPDKNDEIVAHFNRLQMSNVNIPLKRDGLEMVDVHQEKNLDKEQIYEHCPYASYRKIVQDRIYPCCVIFGQGVRQNIDLNEISVAFDGNWREHISGIDIEQHCRRCFIDVKATLRKGRRRRPRRLEQWRVFFRDCWFCRNGIPI